MWGLELNTGRLQGRREVSPLSLKQDSDAGQVPYRGRSQDGAGGEQFGGPAARLSHGDLPRSRLQLLFEDNGEEIRS